MARIDQSKAPYYSRIIDEDYNGLLYRPGMMLQAAELNEVQLIQKNQLKKLADTLLKDGDIKSGAQIIIRDNKKSVLVTSGEIYYEGLIRNFKEQEIEVKGLGTERIGVKIEESIVTANDDKKLLSPSAGFENFGRPGADRFKQTLKLAVNDDEATTIYLLNDGNLVNTSTKEDTSFIDKLNNTLARRTYDESGHYKVYGMELSQKSQYDEDRLYLSLSQGKAYVLGYEIEKTYATTIPIDRSTAIREVIAEPKVFEKSNSIYPLNNNPVDKIKKLIALISVTTDLTRQGAVNGSDPIPGQYNPVVDIQKITEKSSGTEYKKNTDFRLEANTVRWIAGGKQPELGATYTITFTYNKQMVQGTDYKLSSDNEVSYIELLSGGDKPVDNSQMQIDYEFFLAYMASITMDKNGLVRVVKGQANTVDKVYEPDINDQEVLLMGNIIVRPKNDVLIIKNALNTRTSMATIIRLAQRLSDMEINQAITDLDKEAMEGEEPTLLKGIFTDGFLGFSKSDINHKEYDASIDPINQVLTIGHDETVSKLTVDKDQTSKARIYERIATAESTIVKSDDQPYATKLQRINPYTSFPEEPRINISPKVDNWIDEENIILERDGGTVVRHESLGTNVDRRIVLRKSEEGTSTSNKEIRRETSNEITTNTQTYLSAIEYMRPIDIKVEAENFSPNQDGIVILFNDMKVEVKPENATYKGKDNYSLKADGKGLVKASFTIPKNTRCGSVNIEIFAEDLPNLKGMDTFTADGRLRKSVTTNTHTKVTTVYTQTHIVRYIDPVAQSFSLEKDHMLDSVGIFFGAIEKSKNVIVQVRECTNGYPNNVVLAETIIPTEDINISQDGSVETKVIFKNPVYCKKDTTYAFTVLTTSNKSAIFAQELGEKDLLTKEIVAKNPYVPGLMFSSSNALSWTAHNTENLKFNLYVNEYEKTSYVYFNKFTNIDFDGFNLLADTSVPVDTNLTWEYSADEGKTWLPLAPEQVNLLDNSLDSLSVRATIETKGNVSPAIALDSLLIAGLKNKNKSNYVSRNITLDQYYTDIKVIADVYSPSGTGVTFYYSTDVDGKEWKPLSQSGEAKVKVVGGFTEYTYTATVSKAKNFRVKIAMTTNKTTVLPMVRGLKCIMK